MEKDQKFSLKEAAHELQLFLLDGIRHENQLFAAGSLMSRSDYEDVVTERSISQLCGYPLCTNHLPSERPWKGRYRISLKEHKVYDLEETYMYCSSGCLINSRAFAGSLQPERCSVSDPVKINEVLSLFGDSSFDESVFGMKGDLGLSNLRIQETEDTKAVGGLSMEDWVGPSNAIEGYIPKDRSLNLKPSHLKQRDEGSKSGLPKPKKVTDEVVNEMDFTSTIIIEDPFNNPKTTCYPSPDCSIAKLKESIEGEVSSTVMGNETSSLKTTSGPFRKQYGSIRKLKEPKGEFTRTTLAVESRNPTQSFGPSQSSYNTSPREYEREVGVGETIQSTESTLKSSLKCSGAKKSARSVSWADEKKISDQDDSNICSVRQKGGVPEDAESSSRLNVEGDNSARLASAEACAAALSQAAEAVASGESDAPNAEAGIMIFPHIQDADEENSEEESVLEPELMKWSRKPGFAHFELHDKMYCDSWYDTVPEGFNLGLSSFATMSMALFGWITSSSLAYIYGRDESSYEEFSVVNGKEYPRKEVLSDGRSSEIKQTLAGCLAQALPGLVMDLRLPTPVSALEQGLGQLLDTMSFLDALPPFKTKQWTVIILVFIDALSVSRFPALTPHMTSRRMLLHKVLDGAGVSIQEYETMKDIVTPLGRLPQFSTQSGA